MCAQAAIVAEVVDDRPPAERSAGALRERPTRPPDWRYLAACAYVRSSREGTAPQIPSDPVVLYAARALGRRTVHGTDVCTELVDRLWPDLSDALYYGVQHRESATSCEMDACIIKGWTWKQARTAGCPVSENVFNLYRLLFMDLSGMEGSGAMAQDYLFEPRRYTKHPEVLRTHLLAYYGNGDAGLGASVIGSMSDEDMALVRKMMRGERTKQLFDYVAQNLPMIPEARAGYMESALKTEADREFQEHMKDRDEAGSESMDELANGLEGAIRAYTQSELASYDKDGLDFDNQYTRKLIGTNDGKENIE